MTARGLVYELLLKTESSGAYSNIALDTALGKSGLKSEDKAFATALFYGALERKLTLDYLIRKYSKIEYDKLAKETVVLLRMGFYQLLYMPSVPESAAVNETVNLSLKRSKGFINAVLRNFTRDGKTISYDGLEGYGKLSVMYSCPKWLVKMWSRTYGEERTENLLKSSLGRPPLYVRVNTLKITSDGLIGQFAEEGITARKNAFIDDCLEIDKTGGIEKTKAYKNGLFHVQDISSQICCKTVAPKAGETVLDMCAAPGGKTFTMAELMENKGALYSFDLYENRVSLIKDGAKRLGADIVTARVNDATVFDSDIPMADKVLCDAVCSGFGVIRRKPEIKYKQKQEIAEIPEIQKKILDTAKKYVKVGGILVYSTCTLNYDENEAVVTEFLRNNPNFSETVVPLDIPNTEESCMRSFFPEMTGGDGFFTATLRRTE